MKLRYVFLSGLPTQKDSYDLFLRRKVTVKANFYDEADLKARNELDRRCEKAGEEPPTCWDLELVAATPIKATPVKEARV